MAAKTITFHQLCEHGLSQHQVSTLTQDLPAIEQDIYQLRDVITAIRHYLAVHALQAEQHRVMHRVLRQLLKQLDNLVVAPFGLSRDQQIGFFIQKILHTQASLLPPTAIISDPANVVLLTEQYPEAIPE